MINYHANWMIDFINNNYRNQGFDIERVKESSKQLEGIHDLRTFMKVSKEERTVSQEINTNSLIDLF